jgi:hypothetical protein
MKITKGKTAPILSVTATEEVNAFTIENASAMMDSTANTARKLCARTTAIWTEFATRASAYADPAGEGNHAMLSFALMTVQATESACKENANVNLDSKEKIVVKHTAPIIVLTMELVQIINASVIRIS